jgi:hypothetical protein
MKASNIAGFSAVLLGFGMMISSAVVHARPQLCTQQTVGQFRYDYSYGNPNFRDVYRCEYRYGYYDYSWVYWDTQYCPSGSGGPCYSV